MIFGGIDAGSRSLKAILYDPESGKIAATGLVDQGTNQAELAEALFSDICKQAGIPRSAVRAVVATGYGRHRVNFATTAITEITCHAHGVCHLLPETRTIIEIGGQDSKCIWVEPGGQVRDFAMNDRCAAGSGRFLEVVASRLGVQIVELGQLSAASQQAIVISSMCVVFAETEIIGLLAEGALPADIAAGVQNAIATRIIALLGRAVTPPVCLTGGVALQPGMVRAIESALGCPVSIPDQPQFTGALGAALLACREAV